MPAATAAADAARGAAGRALGVPRVARRAEAARLGDRQDARTRAASVVPTITKPASRRRRTTLCVVVGRRSRRTASQPIRERACPSTARLFLIAIGTPANGRSSPGADRRRRRRARARASTCDERVERRVELLDARSEVSTSSRAEISPERTSAASSSRGAEQQIASDTVGAYAAHRSCDDMRLLRRQLSRKHQAQKASAMSAIAAPRSSPASRASSPSRPRSPSPTKRAARCATAASTSRTSSATVPYEQVWGLLVDGRFEPGLPPAEPHAADGPLRRPPRRRAVGAGDARARVGLRAADRHLRRGGARQPRPRVGDGAVVRRAVRARSRPAAGAAGGGRPGATRSPSAS